MRVRLEKDGTTVALEGPPFARGGEAAIHPLPDRPGLLAKVYHKPTPEQADKLAAMIANPPADPTARQGHVSIAWPLQRLLADDGGGCVGFVMPRVDKALSLFDVYNPKSRLQTWPLFHYGYLLRTARNLSIVVRALHAKGYVLGDLNESNVLVSAQTLVTVVDTDSFQVRDGGRVFRCTVGKPEYVAPEIQSANFAEVDRTPEQDAFALAVLIFQMLMQGTHPFAGRFTGQGEPETLARRIAAGHWPYARTRTGPFAPNPTAPPFTVLPFPVRELMHNCFEDGHGRPSARPDAGAWQKALAEADAELVECPANTQHRFHKALEGCPWCELAVRQGRDPFPSKEMVQVRAEGSGGHRVALPGSAPPKSKPAASAPPPLPPAPPSKPASRPSRKPAVRRKRATGVLAYALTPWPYLIAAGVTALGVLIYLIAANTRQPAVHASASSPTVPDAGWRPPGDNGAPPGGTQGMPGPPGSPASGRPNEGTPGVPDAPAFPRPMGGPIVPKDEPPGDLREFKGHTDRVSAVALTRNGDRVVSGGLDGTVHVWDVESGKELWSVHAESDQVLCVAVSPDDRYILSGGRDHEGRLWDLKSGKELGRLKGHTDFMRGAAFSPDGRRALTCGDDHAVCLWDVDTAGLKRKYDDFDSGVMCVGFSPDGGRAACGCVDGSVRVWDLGDDTASASWKGHTEAVHSVAFDAGGLLLLTAGEDGTIRLWNIENRAVIHEYKGQSGAVRAAAFTPDGRGVLSCGDDGAVRLWDAEASVEVCKFETPDHFPVTSLAFGADNRRAVTGGNDKLVRLWSLPDPRATPEQVAGHAAEAAPPP